MKRILLLVAATAVMASAVGTLSSISEASCAAPMVKTPKTAQLGTVITVRGLYFAAECNDTGGCTVGCAGEVCDTDEPAPPYTDLRINPGIRGGGTYRRGNGARRGHRC